MWAVPPLLFSMKPTASAARHETFLHAAVVTGGPGSLVPRWSWGFISSESVLRLAMQRPRLSKDTRDFLWIVTMATALGFGAATASLYSLRHGEGGLFFEFSAGTVVAFLAGAALASGYWRLIVKRISRAEAQQRPAHAEAARDRRLFIVYSVVLGLLGLGCLLYPLRYSTRENLVPVIQGLVMAFAVVAVIGGALWGIARFITRLDKQTSESSEQIHRESDADDLE